MSPVLQEKVPPGRYLADAVVRPDAAGARAGACCAVAFEHDVPVTPRGAGTGNYGQATPFDGGILLDLRGLDAITVNAGRHDHAPGPAPGSPRSTRWVARPGGTSGCTRRRRAPRSAGSSAAAAPAPARSSTGTTTDGFVVSALVAPDGRQRHDAPGHRRGAHALHPHLRGHRHPRRRRDPHRPRPRLGGRLRGASARTPTWWRVHRSLLDLPQLPRLASADEPALVPTLTAPMALDPDPVQPARHRRGVHGRRGGRADGRGRRARRHARPTTPRPTASRACPTTTRSGSSSAATRERT